MFAQPGTRNAAARRWIRAATAALMLISAAGLAAQNEKDREKKQPPPPPHHNPPPQEHREVRPSSGQPAPRSVPQPQQQPQQQPREPGQRPFGNPPSNPPTIHHNNPPSNPQVIHNNPPSSPQPIRNSPPSNPQGYGTAPSGRPSGMNPNDRPRPSYGSGGNRPMPSTSRPGYTPGPRPAFHGSNGTEVRYHPDGRPAVVRTRTGMVVTHTPGGVSRTEYVRTDRTVVVTRGAHWGYVQRPFAYGGVSYVQRTYVVGGVSRAYIYRPYVYRGFSLNVYVSSRYYAPAFYGWAYTPWVRPVAFSFGWGPRPWFGFYAGYFAPYPVYAGPAFWLTDYMIAMSLQDAYDQQMQAAAAAQPVYQAAPDPQAGLTPEVKQAIADEVHRQLDQERMESQSGAPQDGAPGFLSDNSTHVFVVSTGLDVQAGGGECSLTEGDVIQMTAPPLGNSATADLTVMASKGQDCRKGMVVTVAIADLQDMQNHMRETLDQGLQELQSRQGQGGIPPAPAAANRPPIDPGYVRAAPPADPNAASDVNMQAESALEAENEVLDQAQGSALSVSGGGTTQSVSLGMTIDQVIGILGQPAMVGDLGSKKIYSYGNMKVIFIDGKVTDIQ